MEWVIPDEEAPIFFASVFDISNFLAAEHLSR